MQRNFVIGPSLADLRPVKSRHAAARPIFPRLAEILAGAEVPDPEANGEPFDNAEVVRYVCAVLATWVYADLETVAVIMARLGLEHCRCRSIELSNNGALIRSTGYLIQSADRKVALLVYRGTDPFDLSTWAVSADVNPETVAWDDTPREQGAPAASGSGASDRSVPIGPHNPLGRVVQGAIQASAVGVGAVVGTTAQVAGGALQGASNLFGQTLGRAGGLLGLVAREAGLGPVVDATQAAIGVVESVAANAGELGEAGLKLAASVVQTAATREPATRVISRAGAQVHAGFYRNQRATWFDLVGALQRAVESGDIFRASERRDARRLSYTSEPETEHAPADSGEEAQTARLQHLYVCGHSLGAAMAILAVFRLATDPDYAHIEGCLRHVYGFAPPRVGNAEFAKRFNEALTDKGKASCFVYKKDVVPRLPPLLDGTLEFAHVGQFHGVDGADPRPPGECSWTRIDPPPERASSAGQLLLAFAAALGDDLNLIRALLSVLRSTLSERLFVSLFDASTEQRRFTLYDHKPDHYVAVSQLANRKHRTELGDDF